MNWFKSKYLVVEVEKPRPSAQLDPELATSVASLQHHPGFQWILNKLSLQRAMLATTLQQQRQETMADVEFLKSGIAWTGWLEDQLRLATSFGKRQSVPQEALDYEQQAFEQVARNLDIVE